MQKQGVKPHYAWLILIGCCFLQAGGLGGVVNTAGVFLVPITDGLGFGHAEFALWLTLLYLSSAIAMPFIARFLNSKNFKAAIIASMLITLVAFCATSFYTQIWQWYVSGIVIGVIGSFNFICLSPILLENWFYKKTGTAIGIAMAFSAAGGAVFSILTTTLIASIGWRSTVLVLTVIIFCLIVPWVLFVFRYKPEDIGLEPYGFEAAPHTQSADKPLETGVPFRRAIFTFAFLALFIFAGEDALFGGYNAHIPAFAVSAGLTEMDGSLMLSLIMIGCVVFSVLMGIVADRFGVEKPTYLSFVIGALCFPVFIFSRNVTALYIAAFVFGISGVGVAVCVPLLVEKIFGKRDYGPILALTRMGTGAIGSFGPALIGLSFDMTSSYNAAFVGGIIALITCIFLVFAAVHTAKKIPWEQGSAPELAAKIAVKNADG
jgi:MFS family permease